MASYTPILHLPEVAPNQNQKEDTINTALAILEAAMNDVREYTITGTTAVDLTMDDYTRYFLHRFSGQTGATLVHVPSGTPRWFAVENAGSFPITVDCFGFGLSSLTLEVPAGHIALAVSDGENVRTVVPQDGMGLLQDLSDVQGTPTNGQLLRYNGTFSKWEPWTLAQAFLGLTDAPHSYTGAAGKIVAVNSGGSGLEFITSAANINSFVDLDDTPSTYGGSANYYVKVSGGASGLIFDRSRFTDGVDTPNSYGGAAGKFLRVNSTTNGVIFGNAPTFLELTDTPDAYAGNESKFVSVKADGSGLEFNSGTGGPDRFITLLDTPSTYTGQALKTLRVNTGATGVEFFDQSFLSLSDTPDSYAAQGGKLFRVNPGGTGMVFASLNFQELANVSATPVALKWLRWDGAAAQIVYDTPTFLGLADTPSAYVGNEGKFVYVKGDGSGLGFTASSANLSYLDLNDTVDTSYTGKTGMSPIVTIVGSVPQLQLGYQSFATLVGGPGAFAGNGSKLVAVKADASGLEYIAPPASTLDGLTDVTITDPQDGQGLVYNAILGWVNEDLPEAGGGTGVPSNGSHLYWRLLLHTPDGSTTRYGIQEIEFKRTKTGTDLATGGVASASSTSEGAASGAFDNIISGAWFSTTANDGEWIKYAFTAPAEVRYLTLMGSQDYPDQSPSAFSIQWSDDDVAWTTAWEVTGQTGWAPSQIREYHAPLDLFFTDLADAPASYIGQALKTVRVNASSTALEFFTPDYGPTTLAELTDVNIPAPADKQVLSFDDITNKWVALTLTIPDQLPAFRGEWSGSGEMITLNSESGVLPTALTPDAAGFSVVATQPDATAGTANAIKTRPTANSALCYLEQTVNFVSDTPLKVRYKVSSESGFDFFRVLVDNVVVHSDSGVSGVYEEFSTTLTGVHTVRYQYSKDSGGITGDDCTYISQITYKQVLAIPFTYGDTVTYGGVTYYCLLSGTSQEPGTGDEWIAFSAGGGGSTALSDLTDVEISGTPTDGQVLTWNAFLGKWVPTTPSGGGGSDPTSPHGPHAYWRILINATDGGANAEIGDLNFQPVLGGGYLTSIDTGFADSSSVNGGHNAANGLDQDDSTYWQAVGDTAEWLSYHIDPTASTVMSVLLTASTTSLDLTNMPAAFDVEYSDDGLDWTLAWSVTGSTGWTSGEQREFIDPGVYYPPAGASTFLELTDTPDFYMGQLGKQVVVNAAESGLEFTEIVSDFGVFVSGKPLASEKVVRYIVATPFTVLEGTHQGSSDVASTASKVFSFTKNGTQFLTATFAAAGAVPTFSANVETAFAAGDVLAIIAPAVADATLADISFTLKGRR